MNISYYNSTKEYKNQKEELSSLLNRIRDGEWKDEVSTLRHHLKNDEKKEAMMIKGSLPAFTHNATFNDQRKLDYIDTYNGLIGLDYDKVDDVEELKTKVMTIPYTYTAFISPSGNGLKVFVRTTASIENHKEAFTLIRRHYDEVVGIESDGSVQDISRLCYVSYDKDLYLNESSEVVELTSKSSPEWIWSFTSNLYQFESGQRNNFIYRYGCNANRYDIDINDTINYALIYSESDFSSDEIHQAVESAYENNTHERGKYAGTAFSAETQVVEEKDPFIPEWIYERLPDTLRRACEVFKGRRERDVFCTSALSVISAGLFNVEGLYANERVSPNLYSFVIAPAASGKGSMKFAKQLGDCFHEYLTRSSREEAKRYKQERRVFELKMRKAKEKDIENIQEPTPPKKMVFFLPANTSSSMLIKLLDDNGGIGCFSETEADTLTTTLKQDWGNFSDILRKGFNGETITKSRVTDMEYLEVKYPKFSVCITGTPSQRATLLTSVEDGLFSRFIFYNYTPQVKWKSTYTADISRSKQDIFSEFSAELCDKFKANKPQRFVMTKEQGERLDKHFEERMHHNVALYNENITGITFRLAKICHKICMVLSALRSDDEVLKCSDNDFETALHLVSDVYMPHSINLLNSITSKIKSLTQVEERLLEWIKQRDEFKRGEIRQFGANLNIAERTLSDILNKFIDKNLIHRVKNGLYAKR